MLCSDAGDGTLIATATLGPERFLEGLNPAQREAASAVTGPVAILAGAGTGKTRVVSRRVAYAVASRAVDPARVLLVTFTEKAAQEMVERVSGLGLTTVAARTFHSAALAQLRYFWPLRHDGEPLPRILDSKVPIVGRLARSLPGGYRFTPAKDLADEIEWAKSRRIAPNEYLAKAATRTPPIPAELFARLYADYERQKQRAGQLDFDDMLGLTVELLETDEDAARLVRARYTWFTVDEYQDTSPLQQRLLELWLGDGRDVCVVGDEDQTIYSFTGADPAFLTGFASRYPGARVVALTENYRSTRQVLDLANRLIAADGRSKRLESTRPDGPSPTIQRYEDDEAERDGLVRRIRGVLDAGVAADEVAVLVRINALIPPLEEALTRAGVGYRVRGQRFYARFEVRRAIELLRRAPFDETGPGLIGAVRGLWTQELGYDEDAEPEGEEARQRQASLGLLLGILRELVTSDATAGAAAYLAELERRDTTEAAGATGGVSLLTLHRAKGLEWDAVFLPALEDGTLPIRQALDDEAAVAEERRLLYVGITRARRYLTLSWAAQRTNPQGRESRRRPSRFLGDIEPGGSRSSSGARVRTPGGAGVSPSDDPLFQALRAWRLERARNDAVPPYVIAHDAVLAAIAESRPRSISALASIPGMGPAKLEKYAAPILAVVVGHAS